MRLWSLHPALLDRQGLVACWRESLLAQAVLLGRTRGYTRHPQLERFRDHPEPSTAAAAFLRVLWEEARRRGYRFDSGRIVTPLPDGVAGVEKIVVTTGQLSLEWDHLLAKLAQRSPEMYARAVSGDDPSAHPLFEVVPGAVAPWERTV